MPNTYKLIKGFSQRIAFPVKSWFCKHGVNTRPNFCFVYVMLGLYFVYAGYVNKIYKYLVDNYDVYLRKLYNALNNHTFVNVLFFVGVLYATFSVGRVIFKDRLFSWARLLVELFALETLLWHNKWVFSEIFSGFTYQTLLIAVITLLIILELVKYRFHDAPYEEPDAIVRRYITDEDFVPEEDYQRRVKLAEEIVNRVLATDISKESFSVGITGGWGTGKTTMLDNIKKCIGNRAYVVEFNPWNSQSASQIITDFFSEIRNGLSENYRSLAKPIMRYANLLADIKLNPVETWLVSKVTGYAEKDLGGSKSKLKKELKKVDRPVVVLIDDTDRLESDEMFEVLRLVRNTAKLPNIIYFVTFDKTYLVKQLETKNIPVASQYVEKIFPMEIAMPYAEKHMLISAMYYDINQMMTTTTFTDWLYRNMAYSDMLLAVEILGSYRQVKRFARIYVTELHYMQSVFKKTELDIKDLFWLTMIQLTNHDVYESMFRSPEEFFDTHQEGNLWVYRMKDGQEGKLGNTKKILDKLFCESGHHINNGIRFFDNYYNYFYMGLERGRVSIQEMSEVMRAGDDIDAKMVEICRHKSSQSIYHRLSGTTFASTLDDAKAYLTVLTAWMNSQRHHLMSFLFSEKLTTYYIGEANKQAVSAWFVQRMEQIIDNTNNFQQIAEVLNKLYPMYPTEQYEDGAVHENHVVDAASIKRLCQLTFRKYLEKHPNEDAANILNKGKEIGTLYQTLSVVTDYYGPDDVTYYENFAIDVVIEYFSQHKSQQYDKCSKFFNLTEEDRLSGYADEIAQNNSENKAYLFGSTGNKYDDYLTSCFVNRTEEGSDATSTASN